MGRADSSTAGASWPTPLLSPHGARREMQGWGIVPDEHSLTTLARSCRSGPKEVALKVYREFEAVSVRRPEALRQKGVFVEMIKLLCQQGGSLELPASSRLLDHLPRHGRPHC